MGKWGGGERGKGKGKGEMKDEREPMSHLWTIVVGKTQVHIYWVSRQNPRGPTVGI